ncbi:MAG: electron transfer flavoprotein subunit beta/FixA family protein [Candidatus Xenobia bacterium]
MKVLLLIKQVVDTEARIKIADSKKNINPDGVKYIISPYDEFALEEGVRIKEKLGGEVTALSMGPARTKEALRTCLAVGADKAVHLNDEGMRGGDGFAVATALAAAAKKQEFDLILCGKKAVGVDRGEVGAAVAQMLGLPFISQVTKLELAADQQKATVTREVEGGLETFEVELPAVLSCEKGLNTLRHVPLKGIMMAKSKPIAELKLADLGLSGDLKALSRVHMVEMQEPAPRQAGRILKGEPAEVVKELVRLLREEAKVI